MHLPCLVASPASEPRGWRDLVVPPPRKRILGGPVARTHAGSSQDQGSSRNGGSRKITSKLRVSLARNARASAMCSSSALAPSNVFAAAERVDQRAVPVHGNGKRGSARRGLERQRAGSGKKIEAALARQVLSQPVEQGLADAIRRRPQAFGLREAEHAAAPRAADDANAIRGGCGARCPWGEAGTQCRHYDGPRVSARLEFPS